MKSSHRLLTATTGLIAAASSMTTACSPEPESYVMPFVCSGTTTDVLDPGEGLSEIGIRTGIEYPDAAAAVVSFANPGAQVGDTLVVPMNCKQGDSFRTKAGDGSVVTHGGTKYTVDLNQIVVQQSNGSSLRDGIAVSLNP